MLTSQRIQSVVEVWFIFMIQMNKYIFILFTHLAVLDGAVARPVSPATAGVADGDYPADTRQDNCHNK